jgi:hypothetical protein
VINAVDEHDVFGEKARILRDSRPPAPGHRQAATA